MRNAYWLTYKPLSPSAPKGWPIEKLRDLVSRFEASPDTVTEWWRFASHRSGRVGDRVYLFKQGEGLRGIFGVGEIIDGPKYTDIGSDDQKGQARACIRFLKLVDPTKSFLLRVDQIEDLVPPATITAQASGTRITAEISAELDRRLGL